VPRIVIKSVLLLAAVAACGCSPTTTRLPQLQNMSPEYERRQAQIQDPYPDARMGPDTGFRPPEFQHQRAEPRIAKERFGAALQKERNGNPFAPPPVPTSQYPDSVNGLQ
jgi:hypothetical protein